MRHHDRLLGLLLTSVVGLVVSLGFLHLSAPDLALTQISVEVVTTILLLLALNLLPKQSPLESATSRRVRDGALAAVAGLGTAGLAYAMMTRSVDTISDYYLGESIPGGGGSNVVNVILVDFRGFDTFGEIIVLGIAAVAIYALLHRVLRGASGRRLSAMRGEEESKEAHPLILVVVTRVLLPLALVVGVYILLRGHNMPGGGFIAGLVVGIAFLMQYIASGFAWSARRARIAYHGLIGSGIGIAGLTGIAAWLFGKPFLTSAHTSLDLPILGHVELASAMAFDLGVFLTVVGVVLLSLSSLSRVERRAERRAVHPGPIDIELPAEAPGLGPTAPEPVRGAET
jgi:multicomponent K+:H+ antiporter subunit A